MRRSKSPISPHQSVRHICGPQLGGNIAGCHPSAECLLQLARDRNQQCLVEWSAHNLHSQWHVCFRTFAHWRRNNRQAEHIKNLDIKIFFFWEVFDDKMDMPVRRRSWLFCRVPCVEREPPQALSAPPAPRSCPASRWLVCVVWPVLMLPGMLYPYNGG